MLILCNSLLVSHIPPAFSEDTMKLDSITVKGEAISTSTKPTTVNVITSDDFEDINMTRTDEILEEVPGIEIHNYGQGGVANEFSMRGFRNAAHGGDAAIVIDGISLNESLSHADGYADMNVIIPMEINRVEIYKGPTSPLFGNFARGGAISFHTRKDGNYVEGEVTGGSYETFDTQVSFGTDLGKVHNNTAAQIYTSGGYQDNSSWIRGNLATRFGMDITDKLDAALTLRFHQSEWDAPGYVPESQFRDDATRLQQAENAEDDGGSKHFNTQRLDVGYDIGSTGKVLGWLYTTQHDFTRFAKFGYTPGGQTERFYDRNVYGYGLSHNYEGTWGKTEVSSVLGAEFFSETTEWQRYNTSNRTRTQHLDQRDFLVETSSLFGELDVAYHPLFQPWIGFRYDGFSGDYKNMDPGTAPFESSMNDYSNWSPKAGFHSALSESLNFRTSYSENFVLPNGPEKYNAELDVDTETIKQVEAGINFKKGTFFETDLSAFIINHDGEIQEYPAGSGIFVNLGETERKGIELTASIHPTTGLEIFGDLTVTETEIVSHSDPGMVGNKIQTIPDYTSNLGFRYTATNGFGVRANWRHVDEYFVDAANTSTYEGYDLVDTSVSYGFEAQDADWEVSLKIDNLLDEQYSQAVWYGYGYNNYAVSSPRTFWLTLNVKK